MLYFCIFDSFRVKNKEKERSTREPAHAGSCRCGPEIKFLDRDRPAAHVADNGPGRAQIVSGRVSARPRPTSNSQPSTLNYGVTKEMSSLK